MTRNRRGRPKRAVGYIRVSTEGQAYDGFGLEQQADVIRIFAEQHGFALRQIYEDVASGNDRWSMKDRPGFLDAVRQSQREHGVILVARLDRVSRNDERFLEFCRGEKLRLVSTVPGETESFKAAVQTVKKAADVRQNIVDGTERSLAFRKAQGVSLGNAASLPAASMSSVRQRAIASHMKVLDIRDFLLRHPEHRSWTAAMTADRLNQAKILSGRKRLWTKHSLRRQLRLAKEELALLVETEAVD